MSIELIIGAAGTTLTLYQIIKESNGLLIAPKQDDFLNYNPSYLLGLYSDENPIAHHIPYSEIVNFYLKDPSIQLLISKKPYLDRSENHEWREVSNLGFSKLRKSKRVKDNDSAIRLTCVENKNNTLTLTLQKARYHDQCRSNLILDYVDNEVNTVSLRSMLKVKYENSLPKLNDTRLANTIGVAVLIFYKHKNEYIPYMVKRVKKVGVFPGGVHCTASGVAKWPKKDSNAFNDYFTENMYAELEEEVGLQKNDIEELVPMSICREFARGGKPQIFFAGITHLTKSELVKKRIQASKVIKETNLWPEIEQTRWYNSEIVLDADTLSKSIKKYKITLEGVAALHYGIIYLKKYSEYND